MVGEAYAIRARELIVGPKCSGIKLGESRRGDIKSLRFPFLFDTRHDWALSLWRPGNCKAYPRLRAILAFVWCVFSFAAFLSWCFMHVLPHRFAATAVDSHMLKMFYGSWALFLDLLTLLCIRMLKHSVLCLDSSVWSCCAEGEHCPSVSLMSLSAFCDEYRKYLLLQRCSQPRWDYVFHQDLWFFFP